MNISRIKVDTLAINISSYLTAVFVRKQFQWVIVWLNKYDIVSSGHHLLKTGDILACIYSRLGKTGTVA